MAGSRRRTFLGGGDLQRGQHRAGGGGGSLGRDEGAGRAGQVLADGGPGAAGTGPDEAHQQQGQSAEEHMGADALFGGGARSRAQLRMGRQVPPAPLPCSTCW